MEREDHWKFLVSDTRRTRLLAVGLVVVVLVLFQRQLRLALDAGRAFETRFDLALVPSAVILVAVLLLYFQARRHEQRMQHSVSDARSRERQERNSVLDGLTRFGLALARASDMESVRDVSQQMLPQFAGARPLWAVVRARSTWESIAGGLEKSPDKVLADVERLADQALKRFAGSTGEPEGTEWEGHVYYPLVVEETVTGILAVQTTGADATREDTDWRRTMGSAAILVGIAARRVQLAREVEEKGVYDDLTGCFNRTHSMRVLQKELQRARRQKVPFALIMLDLDHFKRINDTYGHVCGDAILAAVGQRIRDVLRNTDTKCRYGGEEFMVLLPDTPRPAALHVAESLRRHLAETSVTCNGQKVSTTASVGLAMALPKEMDATALIERADAALYRAKNGGRNQVCDEKLPETPTFSLNVM